VVPGSVQVPGDGQPIVLMRDCQPPGGYPKIATVVTADLGRLAQSRAGAPVHFRQVGIVEAQLLRKRMVARMASLPDRLVPTSLAEHGPAG
jgi:allophanate hydrolase subunit 2